MLRHRIKLADGTVVESGTSTGNAIIKVKLTEEVNDNDEEDLMPGAASAACLEIELLIPEGGLQITHGNEFELWRVDTETKEAIRLGVFLAEQPTKSSANKYKLTAYDRMTLLDKDLSPWLREQQENFPMSLTSFIQAVCAQCGVTLADGTLDGLPNGGYQIQSFYSDDLTGRQLIRWAAQAACRFARMTPDGKLEFAWYKRTAATRIGPTPNADVRTALLLRGQMLLTSAGEIWRFGSNQLGFLDGTLEYEDYETAPIDKVQIRQSDDDVGVIYPADETDDNALVIQGNLLLLTDTADALRPVAQAIYNEMDGLVYTPLAVSVPLISNEVPAPGTFLSVSDLYGRQMTACIMRRTISGQRVTLEGTGNARRDSTAAVNDQSWEDRLRGRMLEISADVDGLKITASDLAGGMAQLQLTVEGFETQISGKLDEEDAETLIEQSLESLTLSATAGNQSSRLVLKAGSTELTSAEITFNGLVNFVSKSDLSTAGKTTINGGNVTTGKIGNVNGNTVYDLDAGALRTGRSGGTRVEINDTGIRWYYENYLTGVLYSQYSKSYIGDNSRYTFLGWFSSGTPNFGWSSGGKHADFVGIAIDQTGTIHCNADKFEIPGRIECASLGVNGREI